MFYKCHHYFLLSSAYIGFFHLNSGIIEECQNGSLSFSLYLNRDTSARVHIHIVPININITESL